MYLCKAMYLCRCMRSISTYLFFCVACVCVCLSMYQKCFGSLFLFLFCVACDQGVRFAKEKALLLKLSSAVKVSGSFTKVSCMEGRLHIFREFLDANDQHSLLLSCFFIFAFLCVVARVVMAFNFYQFFHVPTFFCLGGSRFILVLFSLLKKNQQTAFMVHICSAIFSFVFCYMCCAPKKSTLGGGTTIFLKLVIRSSKRQVADKLQL